MSLFPETCIYSIGGFCPVETMYYGLGAMLLALPVSLWWRARRDKARRKAPSEELDEAQFDETVERLCVKWVEFLDGLAPELPLTDKFKLFIPVAEQDLGTKDLNVVVLMTGMAANASGLHTQADIDRAMNEVIDPPEEH